MRQWQINLFVTTVNIDLNKEEELVAVNDENYNIVSDVSDGSKT